MAQVCMAGKVTKGTCANKNNNVMKNKTGNKAQVRCAQSYVAYLRQVGASNERPHI